MKSIVLSNSVLRVSWLSLWLNGTLKTLPFVVDCVLLLLLIFFSNQLKIMASLEYSRDWCGFMLNGDIQFFCFQCAFHWSSWFKFWRAIKLNNVFWTTDWISQLRNKKQSAQRFLVSFLSLSCLCRLKHTLLCILDLRLMRNKVNIWKKGNELSR